MEGQSADPKSIAIQHRLDSREERAVPLYAQGDGPLGPRSSNSMGVNEAPSSAILVTSSQEPRRRGNSAARQDEQLSQIHNPLDEMSPSMLSRVNGTSRPRRTSSLSLQGPPNAMLRYETDVGISLRDPQMTAHATHGQYSSRRSSDALAYSEVLAPRWQPDAEVTFCPICKTQFSFFVRKHHCRKCGRVVCNSCSPHRITIPHQYIVQPPLGGVSMTTVSEFSRPGAESTGAGSSGEVTTLGGGERVRLCNPCVPDPNVAPPQPSPNNLHPLYSPNRQGRSASAASSFANFQRQSAPGRDDLMTFQEALRNDPRRSDILNSGSLPRASYNNQIYGPRLQESWEARSRSSTVSGASHNSEDMRALRNRIRGRNPKPPSSTSSESHTDPRSENATPMPGSSSATRDDTRHSAVPEEDSCWICGQELASRILPDWENQRSIHVSSCVDRATQGPSSQPAHSSPAPADNGATAEGPDNTSTVSLTSSYRQSGLFAYTASEKDCVDDAECTICLEDFEVGADMGRLECLCRFHYMCIKRWWEKKDGQCPVHQPPSDC